MTRPEDLGRGPLVGRRRDLPPAAVGPAEDQDDASGRPCWVIVGGADHPARLHAWRRSEDDPREWEGLVLVWLPAAVVRPRRGDPGARSG